MSLRSKILVLFVTLALAPLIAVGISAYLRSIQLVGRLVEANLTLSIERSARAVGTRYLEAQSDLRVLAEEYGAGAGPAAAPARWSALSGRFASLEVRRGGAPVATLKRAAAEPAGCVAGLVPVSVPVPGRAEGTALVGGVPIASLLAGGALPQAIGPSGYALLVDRTTQEVLYDGRCGQAGGAPAAPRFESEDGQVVDAAALTDFGGTFRFVEGGSERTASYVNLAVPPWTLVTTTAVNEFTSDTGRSQLFSLVIVVLVALAMAGAFAILISQLMRSLEEVSVAASRIGEGDFTPWLPPPGDDEVGRLTMAIGAMVARIREMMGQLERSRQMAVVGELTSHLSHEIRNPLSSLRLNLQSVERELKQGAPPADLPVVLQLCLREINRLDRVVTNVLRLGRSTPDAVRVNSLHELIDHSLEVVQPQLTHRGVRVERRYGASDDRVAVDGEQLSGALLNLYLNAADAMPEGGTLRVWTELAHDRTGGEVIRAHVSDEGSGIGPELRERIFKPFFTTKSHGSGLGLPLALQTAEAHGGRLYLERRSELEAGAEFVLEIPLADAGWRDGDSSRSWQKPTLRRVSPAPAGAGVRGGAEAHAGEGAGGAEGTR